MAVLAPIPMARVRIVSIAKPGLLLSMRAPKLRLRRKVRIIEQSTACTDSRVAEECRLKIRGRMDGGDQSAVCTCRQECLIHRIDSFEDGIPTGGESVGAGCAAHLFMHRRV